MKMGKKEQNDSYYNKHRETILQLLKERRMTEKTPQCPKHHIYLKIRVIDKVVEYRQKGSLQYQTWEDFVNGQHENFANLNHKLDCIWVCPECSYAETAGLRG